MELIKVGNHTTVTPDEIVVNLTSTPPSLDPNGRLMSDVWVSVVLIMMILACIACVCSCLLYYKFQKWKISEDGDDLENSQGSTQRRPSKERPPDYTVVTGLPTYEQAIELARNSSVCSVNRSGASSPGGATSGDVIQVCVTGVIAQQPKGVYPGPPPTPPSPLRMPIGARASNAIEVSSIAEVHSPKL